MIFARAKAILVAGLTLLAAAVTAPVTASAAPATPVPVAQAASGVTADWSYHRPGHWRGRGYYRPRAYRPRVYRPRVYRPRCYTTTQRIWTGYGYRIRTVRRCR